MAIKSPLQWENSDKKPNIEQHPSVVLVPAVTGDSAWALNLMTIETDAGDVGGNAVAQGAYAERHVPGLVQGHLYKMTVSYVNTLTDVKIRCGGVLVHTMQSGQSKTMAVYEFTPTDGKKLKFDHDTVGNYTGAVTYLKIEAKDPLNLDRIPDA